jgi:hypothetical protein
MKRDEAQIQSPCAADWDAMTGDDARRYCGQCDTHVHNLSAMTEEEARAVVAKKNVCVRYSVDLRTQSVRHRPSRRLMWRAAAVATLTAGLALPAVASISTEPGAVGLLQTAWEALTDWSESDTGTMQAGITAEADAPVEIETDEALEVELGGIESVPEPRRTRMGRVAPRAQG